MSARRRNGGAGPRCRAPRGSAGFTLPEVILIIVIAGVALFPLSMLFANTSIRAGDAHAASIAAQLAEAKMEEITADRNAPSRGLAYLAASNYPPEDPVAAFPGFVRSVSFAPDSVYDGVTFRTVSVTVTAPNVSPVTLTTWFTAW
jgi:Tfp pilus assembly protein PilV